MGGRRKRIEKETPIIGDNDDGALCYARVVAMLGNGRCSTIDERGVERLGIIRGNMRSREWVSPKDIVLLSLRDFQDGKADIIHRYSDAEVKMLVARAAMDVRFAQCVDSPTDGDMVSDDAMIVFEDI